MSRETTLQTLADHRRELEQLHVRSLALFGSIARNEADADSDLDFVVEFESPVTFDRYIELSFFLKNLFHRPIDLLTWAALTPSLRARIDEEACYVSGLSPVSG